MPDSTNGIRPEVQAAMDAAEQKVMKPYNAQLQMITMGWLKLAAPNKDSPCARCAATGQAMLLNGICWSCYGTANGCAVSNDTVPNQSQGVSAVAGAPADDVRCDFCNRLASDIAKTGVTVIRGVSGAHLCGSCACAAAGCLGAKTAVEARAMMAQSQLQAEAVVQCQAMMKKIAVAAPSDLVLLTAAAEAMARVARGG